jgi:hypothetical protein
MNGARRSPWEPLEKENVFFVLRNFQIPPQEAGFEIRFFLYFLPPLLSLLSLSLLSLHFSLLCLKRHITIMVSIYPALFTHHVSTGAKVSSRSTAAPTTTMPPTIKSSSDTSKFIYQYNLFF